MEILSLGHRCPKCQANATEPCKNGSGMVIEEVHSERWPARGKGAREDLHRVTAQTTKEARKRR